MVRVRAARWQEGGLTYSTCASLAAASRLRCVAYTLHVVWERGTSIRLSQFVILCFDRLPRRCLYREQRNVKLWAEIKNSAIAPDDHHPFH
jgi:hypothetical protein